MWKKTKTVLMIITLMLVVSLFSGCNSSSSDLSSVSQITYFDGYNSLVIVDGNIKSLNNKDKVIQIPQGYVYVGKDEATRSLVFVDKNKGYLAIFDPSSFSFAAKDENIFGIVKDLEGISVYSANIYGSKLVVASKNTSLAFSKFLNLQGNALGSYIVVYDIPTRSFVRFLPVIVDFSKDSKQSKECYADVLFYNDRNIVLLSRSVNNDFDLLIYDLGTNEVSKTSFSNKISYVSVPIDFVNPYFVDFQNIVFVKGETLGRFSINDPSTFSYGYSSSYKDNDKQTLEKIIQDRDYATVVLKQDDKYSIRTYNKANELYLNDESSIMPVVVQSLLFYAGVDGVKVNVLGEKTSKVVYQPKKNTSVKAIDVSNGYLYVLLSDMKVEKISLKDHNFPDTEPPFLVLSSPNQGMFVTGQNLTKVPVAFSGFVRDDLSGVSSVYVLDKKVEVKPEGSFSTTIEVPLDKGYDVENNTVNPFPYFVAQVKASDNAKNEIKTDVYIKNCITCGR